MLIEYYGMTINDTFTFKSPMFSCKIFSRDSNKNYRIDDTMIEAIRPPFLQDILVYN